VQGLPHERLVVAQEAAPCLWEAYLCEKCYAEGVDDSSGKSELGIRTSVATRNCPPFSSSGSALHIEQPYRLGLAV